jgi:hypothetical protein
MPATSARRTLAGSLSRSARWSSPAASAKSLASPAQRPHHRDLTRLAAPQMKSAPMPKPKAAIAIPTVPGSPSQAGGCRNPNRLPNGSSIWHSRSPVMMVFGPRCAVAPYWLHSATVASTSETVQHGTVPDGPG